MKKIPNLFKRDWAGNPSRVLPEFNSDADVSWVYDDPLRVRATVKWDGSACMVSESGDLYVRYDHKHADKLPPPGFISCQERDPITNHRPGWIPAAGNPAAKWATEAFKSSFDGFNSPLPHGTYEACGPHFQDNPHKFSRDILIPHGLVSFNNLPLLEGSAEKDFHILREALESFRVQRYCMPEPLPCEGIVFHHVDGRMVKVLASDLGLPWKAKNRKSP